MKKRRESEDTVKPGAGHRFLQKGEPVQEGDEYYYSLPPYGWHQVSTFIGRPYDSLLPFRRRVKAQKRSRQNVGAHRELIYE